MALSDWNPMHSDYHNTAFNRYHQGVGRDLINGRNETAKLFIDNFPTSFGEEGLRNLFSEYGQVVSALIKPSNREDKRTTFGFVTMGSPVSAAKAISALHQKHLVSGYPLRVVPALTDEEKRRRKNMKDMDAEFMTSIRPSYNREDDLMSSVSSFSRQPDYHNGPSRSLLHHPESNEQTYHGLNQNYHHGPGRGRGRGWGHAQHNRYWDGMPESRPIGLSFGRGSFQRSPEISNEQYAALQRTFLAHVKVRVCGHGTINHQLTTSTDVLERGGCCIMEKGLPRKPRTECLKICVWCGHEGSTYRCGGCKMYYCSKKCQKDDWPEHRDICLDVSIHIVLRSDRGSSVVYQPLRDDSSARHSTSSGGRNLSHSDDHGRQGHDVNRHHGASGRGAKNENHYDSEEDKQTKSSLRRRQNDKGYESESSHRLHDKGAGKTSKPKNKSPQNQSESNLKNKANTQEQKKDEGKGNKVSPSHSDTSSNYGKNVKQGGAKENKRSRGEGLVNNNSRKPQQSRKQADTDVENNADVKQKLSKEAVRKVGKTEERSEGTLDIMDGSGDASCDLVNQTIEVGASATCFLTHYESPSKIWIMLKEDAGNFLQLSDGFKKVLDDMPKKSIKKVKAGDLYCIVHEDFWTRVKIITVNQDCTLTAFFPDIGKQEEIKMSDLYPLTDIMRIEPAQAICCCIGNVKSKGRYMWNENAKSLVQEWLGETYSRELSFKCVEKRGNSHALEISHGGENLSEILIAKGFAEESAAGANFPRIFSGKNEVRTKTTDQMEKFMAKDLQSQASVLEENDKIYINITDFESLSHFMVHVISPESKEAKSCIDKVMLKLNLDEGKPYSPVKGELVLARYSADKTWYRSAVTGVSGDQFQVLFVDYGNREEVTAKDIRHIADQNLVKYPALAASVGLWGISCDINTHEAISEIGNLLSDFALEEKKWSVVIKDIKGSSILVDFISWAKEEPLSVLLNEKLSPKLSPKKLSPMDKLKSKLSPQKNETKISTAVTSLSAETFPSNSTVEVVVNFVNSCASFYVMLESCIEKFNKVMVRIKDEVTSLPLVDNPMIGNFVLAKFAEDKLWYRAQIKSMKNSQTCKVFFVDYGNFEEVALASLRQLPSWSSSTSAVAIHCGLDVEKVKLSSDADSSFKCLEGSKISATLLRKQSSDDKCVIKMIAEDGSDLLNLVAEDPGNEVSENPTKSSTSEHIQKEEDLKLDAILDTDDAIWSAVSYINSLTDFFIYGAGQEDLEKLMFELQQKAGNEPNIDELRVGALCTTVFSDDQQWYRAKISQVINAESCVVRFIDYGNCQTTKKQDLRQLPSFAKSLPMMAVPCCFKGFESFLGQGDSHEDIIAISVSEEFIKLKEELSSFLVMVSVHEHRSGIGIVSLADKEGEDVLHKYKIKLPDHPVSRSPCKLAVSSPNKPTSSSPNKPTSSSPNPRTARSPSQSTAGAQNCPAVSPIASSSTVATSLLSDIPVAKLPDSGFEVICTNMENLSEFYCQEKLNNMTNVVHISTSLDEDLVSVDPGKCVPAVKGGVYACLFEGNYTRCVVEKLLDEEKVTIKYIDWGNQEERPTLDLRPLQAKHVALPVTLMKCKLHGVEILNTETTIREEAEYVKIFQDRMRTNGLYVDIVKQDGDVYYVSLSILTEENKKVDIAQDLVEIGIAKRLGELPPTVPSSQPSVQGADEESEEDDDDRQLKELERMRAEILKRKSKKK